MKKVSLVLFASVLFFSCTSDVKSSQNYIESFSYPSINPPPQISIINEQTVYVLTDQELSGIEPTIVPSQGASVKKEGEKYVITAENGDMREYSVVISKKVSKINSFEEWTSDKGYYLLSDFNWTSGNAGISMAFQFIQGMDGTNPESYPTKKTTDGYNGSNAVVLETIKGGKVFAIEMPILSGNFFLGNFNTNKMASNPLTATEFGKIYSAKPKKITGYYKYKEGDGDFITKTGNPSQHDSCDIYAAFYQATDANGKEIILTAVDDLDKSSLAYARLPNCTTTEGKDFHQFVLPFDNYKSEPDFKKYNYKLLITFAASKGGATYEGKIGSQLIIDEVVIEDY